MITIRVQKEPYGSTIDTIEREPFWRGVLSVVRYKRKLYRVGGGIYCPFFITTSLPLVKKSSCGYEWLGEDEIAAE